MRIFVIASPDDSNPVDIMEGQALAAEVNSKSRVYVVKVLKPVIGPNQNYTKLLENTIILEQGKSVEEVKFKAGVYQKLEKEGLSPDDVKIEVLLVADIRLVSETPDLNDMEGVHKR